MEPWKKLLPSYVCTWEWSRYLSGARRYFRRGFAKAKADVRCAELFDREIEAGAARMKADALQQREWHLAALRQNLNALQGQRNQWSLWLEDLRRDLQELETELEALS